MSAYSASSRLTSTRTWCSALATGRPRISALCGSIPMNAALRSDGLPVPPTKAWTPTADAVSVKPRSPDTALEASRTCASVKAFPLVSSPACTRIRVNHPTSGQQRKFNVNSLYQSDTGKSMRWLIAQRPYVKNCGRSRVAAACNEAPTNAGHSTDWHRDHHLAV